MTPDQAYMLEALAETMMHLGKARDSVSTYLTDRERVAFDRLMTDAANVITWKYFFGEDAANVTKYFFGEPATKGAGLRGD